MEDEPFHVRKTGVKVVSNLHSLISTAEWSSTKLSYFSYTRFLG